MRKSWVKAVAFLAAVVVVAGLGLFFGMRSGNSAEAATGKVTEGQDVEVATEDRGVVVRIPAKSFSGSGELRVTRNKSYSRSKGSSGAGGQKWDVELTGARLTGDASISFKTPQLEQGEPAPLVWVEDSGDGTVTVPEQTVSEGEYTVVTAPMLGSWTVQPLHELRDELVAEFTSISAEGEPTAPVCEDEDLAETYGITATARDGQVAPWCLGIEDGMPVLKIANNHSFGLMVAHPFDLQLTEKEEGGIEGAYSEDFAPTVYELQKGVIVDSGSSLAFRQHGTDLFDSMVIYLDPNSYYLSSLLRGVDTVARVFGLLGLENPEPELQTGIQESFCLTDAATESYNELLDSFPTPEGANDLSARAADCVGQALVETGGAGLPEQLIEPVRWLVGSVSESLAEVNAAAMSDYSDDQTLVVNFDLTEAGRSSGLPFLDVRNMSLPANSCMNSEDGSLASGPIQLRDGVGESFKDSYDGASVRFVSVEDIGDLNGDGVDDLLLSLQCTGIPIEESEADTLYSSTGVIVALDGTSGEAKLIGQPIWARPTSLDDPYVGYTIRNASIDGAGIHVVEQPQGVWDFTESDIREVEYSLVDGRWR